MNEVEKWIAKMERRASKELVCNYSTSGVQYFHKVEKGDVKKFLKEYREGLIDVLLKNMPKKDVIPIYFYELGRNEGIEESRIFLSKLKK